MAPRSHDGPRFKRHCRIGYLACIYRYHQYGAQAGSGSVSSAVARCARVCRADTEDVRRAHQEGIPREHDACRDGDDLCLPCNEQCSGCTWFDDTHCIDCKHLRLYEDEENKEGRVRTLLFYIVSFPCSEFLTCASTMKSLLMTILILVYGWLIDSSGASRSVRRKTRHTPRSTIRTGKASATAPSIRLRMLLLSASASVCLPLSASGTHFI